MNSKPGDAKNASVPFGQRAEPEAWEAIVEMTGGDFDRPGKRPGTERKLAALRRLRVNALLTKPNTADHFLQTPHAVLPPPGRSATLQSQWRSQRNQPPR